MLDATERPKSLAQARERKRRAGLAYELWTMSAETGRLPSELLGLPHGTEPDATRALAFDRTIRIAGKEWESAAISEANWRPRFGGGA